MTSAPAAVPHVVLVPRRSQGHVNPFISLAHFLAASGISVTVVHSARSNSVVSSPASGRTDASASQAPPIRIELIRPDISPSAAGDADMCRLLEELLQKLKQEGNLPSCLIVDSSLRGLRDVALKFGLPRVVLFTFSAFLVCLWRYMPEMIAKGYIPAVDEESQEKLIDFIPGVSPIRVADLPSRLKAENGLQSPEFVDLISAFKSVKDADRFLVNTMHELESNVLEALRKESSIVMDPVGPLFKISSIGSLDPSLHQEDKSCLAWLEQQRESSVLYISFGSVATIEKDVFEELAYGLEASGESFLWVIRSDAYKDKAMTMEELLPKGFVGRTGDKGLVISWAPQLAVLAHRSVGAFLTHCGWNSVLESLSHGIPMLGFPQEAEQNTNLKYVVHDWKVGLPLLEANVRNVERTQIQQAVKAIMKGGSEVRKEALEWRDIANRAAHSTSKSNLQKLVEDLRYGHIKRMGA